MQKFNEDDLYNIILDVPIGLCILDAATLIVEVVNERFVKLSGKSYQEVYGKWYWEPFAEAKAEYEESLITVVRTGQPFHAKKVKLPHISRKKEWVHVTFVYSPVRNKIDQITKIAIWVLEDNEDDHLVEELSAAKQDLQLQRDRLNRFFMQVPAGICVLDGPKHTYELVNTEYQKLFPGRLLQGLPVVEALPELKNTAIEDTLSRVYSTGETFVANALLVPLAYTPDGPVEDRYFNFIYQARLNSNNRIDGILVLVFEVTEQALAQKRIKELNEKLNTNNKHLSEINQELLQSKEQLIDLNIQLVESEAYLRMATESAGVGTWLIEGATGEFKPSKRFKEIFGFPPEHILTYDETLTQMFDPYQQLLNDAAEASMIHGKPFSFEHPLIRQNDAALRWVRSVGKSTFKQDGQLLAFSGVLMDITEQKLDEQRKNDFISMVSHELKTPITSLNGYLQIIKAKAEKDEDAFASSFLIKSLKQVGKMTKMINGFLNISRLESGKIHINKQAFDMADLVKEAEEESLALMTSHHVVFAPVEPTPVIADWDKIGQVITNLINNAVKYSPQGSTINVACVTANDVAMVSVKDEGMGISADDRNKLFERFYRVESHATKSIPGFGIGLYLCKEIIERHEGTIAVKSEVGKGSTFYFTLPIA
jgi:two-component system sensor histidine kinase VicK